MCGVDYTSIPSYPPSPSPSPHMPSIPHCHSPPLHTLHPPPPSLTPHPSTHFAITLRLRALSTALQSFLLCCRLRFFPFPPPPSTPSPPPTPPSLSDSESAHFVGGGGSCKTFSKIQEDKLQNYTAEQDYCILRINNAGALIEPNFGG